MFIKSSIASTAMLLATNWTLAQDASTSIEKASHAIGADSVKTVRYSATGFDFAFGQAPNGQTPWPKFIDKSYTRSIDFQRPASKVDRIRLQGENPPRGGGGQPLIGEQSQSQTIVVSASTPWAQQLEIWTTAVGEKTVLADGQRTVELYHLEGLPHHDGMLVAYLPKEKVLFEADAYNPLAVGATPPSPANPNNLALLDNIARLHLDVQRIIPVHYPADNRAITLAEVTRWAGRNGS